jgi:ribosome-associated heat shock protein Hsp15
MHAGDRIRLDKWLWAARFFKTRSMASRAIDLGRVRIEGERVKPAHEARIGETVQIQILETRIDVVVRALSTERRGADIARQLYEETADSIARRTRRGEQRRYGTEPAVTLKGRPTKRDRRILRDLADRSGS